MGNVCQIHVWFELQDDVIRMAENNCVWKVQKNSLLCLSCLIL